MQTIVLGDAHFLAEGAGRRVFRHPDNNTQIIKIQKPRKPKKFQKIRSFSNRFKRRFSTIMLSWGEVDELAAMVTRTQSVPKFYTQFRGFVDTDKGIGCIFDLVRSPDGSLAPTLKDFAERHPNEPLISQAIDALWDDVVRFRAIVWDPSFKNVLVAGSLEAGLQLVIVDGLGERTLIPIKNWSNTVFKRHCEKSRAKMQQRYNNVSQGNKNS